jgi:hypothetical protein
VAEERRTYLLNDAAVTPNAAAICFFMMAIA